MLKESAACITMIEDFFRLADFCLEDADSKFL
jgi:hypothetical protein